MSSIEQIMARARPNIRKLKPYTSARSGADPEELQNSILLNANENPYLAPFQLDDYKANYYPEPQPQALLQGLSRIYGVEPSHIVVGRGSDEAIDLLVRAFCSEKDAIAICSPTFGMYRCYAEIQGCEVIDLPLQIKDISGTLCCAHLPLDKVRATVRDKLLQPEIKLFFIPSPLALLGSAIPQGELLELLQICVEHSIILVVDEAYAEFAQVLEAESYQSMIPYLPEFPNLVVLRTLSKAYGLAGERIGSLLAHPQLASMLRATQSPYPLPSSSSNYATALLSDKAALQNVADSIAKISEQQRRLLAFLQSLPFVQRIFQSAANFIMLQVSPEDCCAIMQLCRENGLILRDFSRDLAGGIRISVGTVEQMDKLMKLLRKYPQ